MREAGGRTKTDEEIGSGEDEIRPSNREMRQYFSIEQSGV